MKWTLSTKLSPTPMKLWPAHGIIIIWITEACGVQFTAHHCGGTLIPSQVSVHTGLPIHTRPWNWNTAAKWTRTAFSTYWNTVEFAVIIRRLNRPCCSMLSLGRGLSLLKDTTDSVSVWSSKDSRLPVVLGLNTHTHTSCNALHSRHICTSLQAEWKLKF